MSVPIIALGARTPVGLTAAASAAAIRAGIRRAKDHPFIVDRDGNALRTGLDSVLEPDRLGGGRLFALAQSALREAVSALGPRAQDLPRSDVLLVVPESRPGFTDTNAAWLAREVSRGILPDGPPAELVSRGHAGALDAIRDACARIGEGRAELCTILAVDSYFTPDTLDWLDRGRRLSGESNRDGFIPGEAACCVVLASSYAASALQLRPLAQVRGGHSAREQNVILGDADVFGHGLTEAILGATLPGDAIDDIYCDINGERYRTDEWLFALLRVQHVLRRAAYQMPATSCGDVGAATGALTCILAAQAWARGYASGPRALLWGSSEKGLRSAVVLERA
jgi:3-oxoacyl-[acyl-carrier-protein] synthase I